MTYRFKSETLQRLLKLCELTRNVCGEWQMPKDIEGIPAAQILKDAEYEIELIMSDDETP